MSLFGSLLGDFDDDGFMGNQINSMNMQMRNMNRFMNNMMMPDPFNMLTPFDGGFNANNSMMERVPMLGGGLFGFPGMPNMNRLISTDIGNNGASFCSSSVISMSSGPDGRPQIYQATSSTKTGPGGIRETRKTVQDSSSGVKKMAIGHHIGERAHIIEKEQNLRSGQHEERQEFINLDEEEAESFDREFTTKARMHAPALEIMSGSGGHHSPHRRQYQRALPALPAPPTNTNNTSNTTSPSTKKSTASSASTATTPTQNSQDRTSTLSSSAASVRRAALRNASFATPRRPLRTPPSSPLALTPSGHNSTSTTTSVHPHPYNNAAARRNFRSKHTKHQQQHQEQSNDESTQKQQQQQEQQQQQQEQQQQQQEHNEQQESHDDESN